MTNRVGGNIGDWSETYVFFRLLGDHSLCTCDAMLNRTNECYPVLKITKVKNKDSAVVCQYNDHTDEWTVFESGAEIAQVKSWEGGEEADSLLFAIQTKETDRARYSKAIKFLGRLNVDSIKSGSRKKQDIILQIGDVRAGTDPVCGFSIKSYLGQPPSLLNSSKDCTNFLYEVTGIKAEDVDNYESCSSLKDLMLSLKRQSATLNYVKCCSDIFAGNLEAVGTKAEQIVAELLKLYYLDRVKSVSEATNRLMESNTLGLKKTKTYRLVVKRLLEAVALGMTPGHEWEGETDDTNGIIIVKPDGDVVTYHIYNRDAFKQYLYQETMFDTPSRKRHQFAKMFTCEGKVYIKLALQIRFKQFS